MSTQTQEFPGLEKLALDMFGIEFAELTPSLRRAVTHRAKMQAAEDMLDALKAINSEAQSWHDFHHGSPCVQCDEICALRPQMQAAIAKAEGRI